MLAGLLGKKLGMTQVFNDNGQIGVTVIEAGPCHVMQVKTVDNDGYNAVQLGFDDRRRKNARKPERSHARKAGVEPKRFVREIRSAGEDEFELGQTVKLDVFDGVRRVDVTGTTKGRGFQGVIRRHGFHGLKASHGVSKAHRSGGSIGGSSNPSRVWKGMKMPGHMGMARRTTRRLRIIKTDPERNLIMVAGAVPGTVGSYVAIRVSANQGREPEKVVAKDTGKKGAGHKK